MEPTWLTATTAPSPVAAWSPRRAPALPPCLPSHTFLPRLLVTALRPGRCSPREAAVLGATAPASSFDEGLVLFPLPSGLASALDFSTSPPVPDPARSSGAAGSRGCCQRCCSLGSLGFVWIWEVLSGVAEFSILSCVCSPRSDPAQQPAPGAPEGGAPEGGAPEGAAPAGGPPGAPPNLTSNRRLQQTQAQVQEVVDIMCVNVDKVLQRDEKLSELDDRADALQAGASVFESSAAKLKRKYWWKNCKMMIMMGVIGALVVVVIANDLLPEHGRFSFYKGGPT
uniref:Vesicle associated membrane protein 1 n=1 Tax=Cyanistes caeruleus TaxID=156563 RepID=A0A8C0V3N2_CYACU